MLVQRRTVASRTLLGNADLTGEAVARATRQDPHRRSPSGGDRRRDDGIGDLVLRAIAAVRDHEVDTVGDGGSGLVAGIAIAVRHAGVPGHAMLAEHIIEDVQDGLVLARCRVDDHVDTRIHGI